MRSAISLWLSVSLVAAAVLGACRSDVSAISADEPASDGGYADLDQMYRSMAEAQPGESDRWACYGRQMGYAQRMGGLVVPWGMHHGPMMGRRGPMVHRAGMTGAGWGVMAAWHREMAALHQRLAAEARRANDEKAAARHDAIAREHLRVAEDLAQTSAPPSFRGEGSSPAALFAHACAPCHQQNGEGVAGTFPPLRDTPIVSGDEERLIRIVLHGLAGPLRVAGRTYYGVMPAFGAQLTDDQIAAVLTYVRTAWRAPAAAITGDQVAAMRTKDAGRSTPWTTAALGLAPEKP